MTKGNTWPMHAPVFNYYSSSTFMLRKINTEKFTSGVSGSLLLPLTIDLLLKRILLSIIILYFFIHPCTGLHILKLKLFSMLVSLISQACHNTIP